MELKDTHDGKPGKLSPNDPRTRRFLAMLIERYRAQDDEHGAAVLEDVLRDYDLGQVERASEKAYATAIALTVTEGDEKSLLVFLSETITDSVIFRRADPPGSQRRTR